MPTPQNSQTHSKNSLTTADELFLSVVDHFLGLAFQGLKEKKLSPTTKKNVENCLNYTTRFFL